LLARVVTQRLVPPLRCDRAFPDDAINSRRAAVMARSKQRH
jgi:hypothetical protein